MMTDDTTNARANPKTPTPNPTLVRLTALVGAWQTEAAAGGKSMGRGRAVFAWLEGGAFLGYHADVEQSSFPTATAIIGGDDSTETYSMLYFDSRAVARVYQMSLTDGVWKLWRDAPGFSQRFIGIFSDDGTTIRGRWEKSADGAQWDHDFDLIYTKVR